ncbi:MAG TPA: tetratricopeptide repeat protein [Ramlibacter sp.]|uniref:methyltransferase n=1 Tax=Ramlibacter sp. TaxID=1917967 RepID=UPI002C4EA57E|nr:tetratricopeptide repeat protein [Ramlibacter sp.]HVZ43917.1 tetratricopeptide repeat protein [Ramlibacter sp.]
MDESFEWGRELFLRGVTEYQAGRYAEAEWRFAEALALVPGRVSTLTNLGAVRLKLGRAADALVVLDQALAQEPDNVEALSQRATALASLGRHEEALRDFDRSLTLRPAQGAAWSYRGNVLREMGLLAEARLSFEQALAHGADRELNSYYLAALGGNDAPLSSPGGYVQSLFDSYAGEFDSHLVKQLRYDAPGVLAARIAAEGRHFRRALDLGCGTGLCGAALAPLCDAIDGVDVSGAMLEKARALRVYSELDQVDVVLALQQARHRYEAVIAADVFAYLGDLEPVFAGVARVLEAGGLFCFTVEAGEESEAAAGFVLRPSLRYAHSRAYLLRLAQAHGFEARHIESRPIREDQRVPIPGLFIWLALPKPS